MRHTRDLRAPRRSGVEGLYTVPRLVELAVVPREAGKPDERRWQERTSDAANEQGSPIYRLLVCDYPQGPANGAATDCGVTEEDRLPYDLDDLVTVEELAAVLHVTRQWIVRRARKLPFVKHISRKKYVCSRILFRRWLATGSGPVMLR